MVKYSTKKMQKESNRDCKSYGTIEICIFHLTILCIEGSNCFDIINSFCSTVTLNKSRVLLQSYLTVSSQHV